MFFRTMRELGMTSKKRLVAVIRLLRRAYPQASCTLDFSNKVQLLVSTILSAQCTDKRVNEVTRSLFKKYRTAKDFASAKPGVLEQEIYSTGFYKNKARSIQGACREIEKRFGGKVPGTMEDLLSLPGVGRKTANVVLGVGHGKAIGVVVDTHVSRLSQRLGFTRQKDPAKIEQDLMNVVPRKDWIECSHLMIAHGRAVCIARKPECPVCPVRGLCPFAQKGMGSPEG